jgi:hypothetical protein
MKRWLIVNMVALAIGLGIAVPVVLIARACAPVEQAR